MHTTRRDGRGWRALLGAASVATIVASALLGGAAAAHAADEVDMPDAALRACVNEQLGPGRAADAAITIDELAAFSDQLRCGSRGIVELTGLEHAAGLTLLLLAGNQIESVEPLRDLVGLRYLYLVHNRISDLDPLRGMTQLVDLQVGWNDVADVSPLAAIEHWDILALNDNRIADISPLAGDTSTRGIDVTDQRIDLPSATVGVPVVNPLVDLDGVPLAPSGSDAYDPATNSFVFAEPMAGYQAVWAWNDPGTAPGSGDDTRFSGILSWPSIQPAPAGIDIPDADLRWCVADALGQDEDDDITAGQLATLITLDCGYLEITDLTGIEHAVNLQNLYLPWNDLGENGIASLAGLTELVELDLEWTGIDDAQLQHLAGLTKLQWLSLTDNRITDLSALATLGELRGLWAQFTPLSDVSPLAGLTSLEHLVLNYGPQIADVSPLAGLTQLESLLLDDAPVADISALAGLTNLTELGLGDTHVADVSPLANLTALEQLNLAGAEVADVSPLAALTSLTELSLDGQRIVLPQVVVGEPQPNPVVDLDGDPVGSASPHYDAVANAFVFDQVGDGEVTTWSTEVSLPGLPGPAIFSGTLMRDVVDAPDNGSGTDPAGGSDDASVDPVLAATGAASAWPALAWAVILIVAGAAVLIRRRPAGR